MRLIAREGDIDIKCTYYIYMNIFMNIYIYIVRVYMLTKQQTLQTSDSREMGKEGEHEYGEGTM